MHTENNYTKTVHVSASVNEVWRALTEPELMQAWMSEEETSIETDWNVGGPITIKGTNHWVYFENHGTVLACEPGIHLRYQHLSSLSRLPDLPENYSIFDFRLRPENAGTELIRLKIFRQNPFTSILFFTGTLHWSSCAHLLKRKH